MKRAAILAAFGILGIVVVLAVGEKGLEDLLKAAMILWEKGLQVKVLLVGAGSQVDRLKEYTREHWREGGFIRTLAGGGISRPLLLD